MAKSEEEVRRLMAQQDATSGFFNRGPDPEPRRGLIDRFGEATLGRLMTGLLQEPGSQRAREFEEATLKTVADFTPVIGDIKAATYDAPQLFAEGHPVWGLISAASALPVLGIPFDFARKLGPAVRGAAEGVGRAPPETIGKATIRFEDEIFTGSTHGEALNSMPDTKWEAYLSLRDVDPERFEASQGFSTSRRDHISREEAYALVEDDIGDPTPNDKRLGSEDLSGRRAGGGPQIIKVRHYGAGANEDVLRTDMQGTGRPGSEQANPDRIGRVYMYAPEVVEANTGRPFQPEPQFAADPFVDTEIDVSQFANAEAYGGALREAREVLMAEKAAGPNPNINPSPTPAAVQNRAEEMLKEQGARGIFDENRGVLASFDDVRLPGGTTGEGIRAVGSQARAYVEQARGAGRQIEPHPESFEYLPVDEDRARTIADTYESLPHDPTNPIVQESYDAMIDETIDQYNFLEGEGVKFEAAVDDPYATSADMIADVRDNNRLKFFLTDLEDFPSDHPLARPTGVMMDTPEGPREMVANDLFRAVHDYFGHSAEGFQFGPRGEENAWGLHSAMYSPRARPAMSFETRGQNSWVNSGPQMRGPDGQILRKGDEGYLTPQEREFAPQKANVLPEHLATVRESGVPAHRTRTARQSAANRRAQFFSAGGGLAAGAAARQQREEPRIPTARERFEARRRR